MRSSAGKKLPQGQIHRFFWAVQRAVRQAFAASRHQASRRSSLLFTTFFLHNAVLDRKLLPTDRSMVDLPCLHVTGHIPFASGANVNIRFFLHSAVLDRKLVPTHRSMVYLPCLHVTGHIPFARGANINIRFFLHNAILHRKLYLSNSIYLSLYLSISLSLYVSIYLSIFLSPSLSLSPSLYRTPQIGGSAAPGR